MAVSKARSARRGILSIGSLFLYGFATGALFGMGGPWLRTVIGSAVAAVIVILAILFVVAPGIAATIERKEARGGS